MRNRVLIERYGVNNETFPMYGVGASTFNQVEYECGKIEMDRWDDYMKLYDVDYNGTRVYCLTLRDITGAYITVNTIEEK